MNREQTIQVMGHEVWTEALPENILDFKTVCTLNAHSYTLSKKDKEFNEALRNSGMLIPDGISIVFASYLLRGKRIRKIAGADLHRQVLNKLNEKKGSCFYLGSSEAVLNLICKRMKTDFPEIRTGYHSPPFRSIFSAEESVMMIRAVNQFAPDVLFVGMTAPKQEKWVFEHRHELHVPLVCSIGAVFDFYAGTVKRPGPFWIGCGLEFLPRFLREPRRLWRRNLFSAPMFILDMLKFKVFDNQKNKRV